MHGTDKASRKEDSCTVDTASPHVGVCSEPDPPAECRVPPGMALTTSPFGAGAARPRMSLVPDLR
jgi:hypothetical protein